MMPQAAQDELRSFWSISTTEVLAALQSSADGLTANAAAERIACIGQSVAEAVKRSFYRHDRQYVGRYVIHRPSAGRQKFRGRVAHTSIG